MLVKGGLFGDDDSSYLAMLLLQMLIIITLSRILVWLFSKIGQPSIIGQVLCGIILGPICLGKYIPGFKKTFFPEESIDNLYMISDFTLILYVFLVGLELNPSNVFQRKRKYPFYIGFISVFFPFVVGLGMSFILKDNDLIYNKEKNITHMLYIGLVLSISALPVLTRIISELGLIQTVVGSSSVSIIAVDNILCWGILIVVSSFINSTEDTLSPLYIFLSLMAAVLFIFFVIRPIINFCLKHYQGNLDQESSISEYIISFMFILLLLSSWTTHRFGGHAVIGSFMFGLILPHGSFTVKMTEKVEDVVVIFLLPMYIAATSLRVEFDVTSDYMFWVWLLVFFIVSSICKIIPASIAARLCKFSWRESFSIGILLNTKGLMDLVVLNMGYDSGIIVNKTYSMFIFLTILTTFSTIPLISKVYSPKYRVPMALNAPTDVEFNETTEATTDNDHTTTDSTNQSNYFKLLVTVTNTKSLPGLMTVLHLLNSKMVINHNNIKSYNQSKLMVHTLRVMEFSERSSTIQMATDPTTTTNLDPISNIIRTFGQINNISIIANLVVAKPSDFASTLSYYSDSFHSSLLIIPYDITESNVIAAPQSGYLNLTNIFENPNEQHASQSQQINNYTYQQKTLRSVKSEYLPGICQFLKVSNCPVGIFVDRGFGQGPAMMLNSLGNSNSEMTYANNTVTNLSNVNLFTQTVMMIFIGGPDDREALKLTTRIAKNNRVHIVIKRIRQSSDTKSPIRETTEEEYSNDGTNFQPSAIKSTSLQTYQRMLSNLTERKNGLDSKRNNTASVLEKKNSMMQKKKTVEIIALTENEKSSDNNNKNNLGEDTDNGNNTSISSPRKNSMDSVSVFSKPSIAVSISSSEKSSKSNSQDDLPNGNIIMEKSEDEPKVYNKKLSSTMSNTPSSPTSPTYSHGITSQDNADIGGGGGGAAAAAVAPNVSVTKSSSLKKRGTLLGKYIRSKKNSIEERFNIHNAKGGIEKSINEEKEEESTKSFSIEIEVDTFEDRAAFSELKKLINKNNSHLSIENVYLESNDQLNDICIDLVHSIGKKDLLIIGRENILPEVNNNMTTNDNDNGKQSINDLKAKNEGGNDYNSYDPTDNTESNIQKTVSSFVTSHFYGGNTNVNSNLQEEARLRSLSGSLGYRVIKECSASVMIVQASKYKGYDRTMEDITELEEEKIDLRRKFSIVSRKSSLRKINSFKDHVKMTSLSTDNIETKKIYKRRSDSTFSNLKNENINSVTIKRPEEDSIYNNINISELAKELDNKRKESFISNKEDKLPSKNRIEFDIGENERKNSNSTRKESEIDIINTSNFSRASTLSKKDEIERERIKKIIKERDSYLINEMHQDIADSDVLYVDSSGDELDTGL